MENNIVSDGRLVREKELSPATIEAVEKLLPADGFQNDNNSWSISLRWAEISDLYDDFDADTNEKLWEIIHDHDGADNQLEEFLIEQWLRDYAMELPCKYEEDMDALSDAAFMELQDTDVFYEWLRDNVTVYIVDQSVEKIYELVAEQDGDDDYRWGFL